MDTIFALASAPGRAGVSVFRISGPSAFEAAASLAGSLPKIRTAGLRTLRDSEGGELDQALVIRFEKGHSFTGEDVVELHCHGSIAIVSAVLKNLGAQPGCRIAEPGEFTRRALENGCMDLPQVEALADLIDSETEAQRQSALKLLSGALSEKVSQWRLGLVRAASLLEAVIDFADEEVPVDVTREVAELVTRVCDDLANELAGLDAAERVRLGFEVAIVGVPNSGKSTLLNYLAGREAAITSEIAGTTRDVLEVRMDMGGLAVTLLDTAGIRETEDVVEAIGVDRAKQRADTADIRIILRSEDGDLPVSLRKDDIVVASKVDNGGGPDGISGLTGAGVPWLIDEVTHRLRKRTVGAGLSNRERHRVALSAGLDYFLAALASLEDGPVVYEITSENIRLGTRQLESLIGQINVEHLLDEIFSSFCIGK